MRDAGERFETIDVVRGFAVLGILAVNAQYFAAPWQTGLNPLQPPLDVNGQTVWSWLVMHVFFEYKCITLFSLLFGASIYLVGGERDDASRGANLDRRLSWLLVFGLIHALALWFGDILVLYALTGFLVMLFRSAPALVLTIVGAVLFAISVAQESLFALTISLYSADDLAAMRAQIWALPPAAYEASIAAFTGDIISVTRANALTWWQFFIGSGLGLVTRTAAMMMLGMALLKSGFLSGRAPLPAYVGAVFAGVVSLALIAWQALENARLGFQFEIMEGWGGFANTALSLPVALGYAGLCALLVRARLSVVTAPLAAAGRMAFTNYIAQSLIMTSIFWGGRGFGLFGTIDRPTLWALVLGVWALQLVWSLAWLSRFEMGPLEWAWRRLSYRAPVQLLRKKA